ncbi:glycosyltransferase [Algoriphagus resistens]|uniref:glycosyltransferase n=1 Tax=Algoriphagus resistens TaxID=1750590 RepID=UPI0007167D05|nr:glycosyltransferase [Algoriphagus resistens]
MKVNQNSSSKVVVSICCLTYNHANFIEQAIEGFLAQKTDFSYEILIHDDASTDGTTEIIQTYQTRYPHLIKPIIQKENQWSKGLRAVSATYNFPRAAGKYIAMCEGDDYWTDPLKLQKQVDFLENNPDYVITYHDAMVIDDHEKVIKKSKMPDHSKRDYTQKDLIGGKTNILTLSMVFRNLDSIKEKAEETSYFMNGDNFITAQLGLSGKGKYFSEIKPAVYRQHAGGVWSDISKEKKIANKINTHYWMYRYFTRIGNEDAAKLYLRKLSGSVSLTDKKYRFILVKHGVFARIISGISQFFLKF